MAKSNPPANDLRQRLSDLLANWNTEITEVLRTLDRQQSATSDDLEELRQRVRDRDLALDYLKKKAKEKDSRIAELERRLDTVAARTPPETGKQQDDHQAELEAMRAELAARKSLIKSLRADAEQNKVLENKLAESRATIAKLRDSIEQLTQSNFAGYRLDADPPDATTDEGTGTIVIDMAESLRLAREVHRNRSKKE